MQRFMHKFGITAIFATFFAPLMVSAQGELSQLREIIGSIGGIVNTLIPAAAALALLGFFFGLAKYIFQAGDEDAQEEGKQIMIWGVVALFLIAAVGGIVEVLADTVGVSPEQDVNRTRIKGLNN